ncbi:reverse transcriptase family protein [Haliangium sp.]|uniref:reverse transcriptase family protein n=1 Tax=Haliangium sp. TaxID=2663208 RepID=UPI003D0C7E27
MSEQPRTSQAGPAGTSPSASGEPPALEWAEIEQAGGIRAWVNAELERRGLIEEVDTARLSDKERKRFKARRDQERRTRRALRAEAWQAYRRAHLVHLGVGVFYHDTPDVDRYDIAEPENRRRDSELPDIADATALADALTVPIPRLRWLAYHREVDTGTHYHRWTVPKRDGGARLISAPKPELKRVQTWIARNISEHLPVHGAAHGFLAGRSTVTNAAVHSGADVVVKLDIRDFYPSITLPRVKGVFRKAGYGEQVATVLALLCTESPREEIVVRGRPHYVAVGPRSLPQGAPTSPSITNALSLRLDSRLAGLARAHGVRYTRYADDLTFSWHDGRDAAVGKLIDAVRRIVADEGFAVHEKKTRVMRAGRRQKVTGLVINRSGPRQGAASGGPAVPPARVPRRLVRQLRAAIHNREQGRPGQGESLAVLRGWAAYVHMTDPKKGQALLRRLACLSETDDTAAPTDDPVAGEPR